VLWTLNSGAVANESEQQQRLPQTIAYARERRYTQSLEHELQVLKEYQNGGPSTTDSSRLDRSTGRMSLGTTPSSIPSKFEHVRDQTLERVNLSSATVVSLIEQYGDVL
jgi:hypothetical protein